MSAGKKNIQDYFKVKPSEERARQSEHEGTDGEQADSETVADDGSQNEAQSSELPTMSPCECPCCTDYTTPHQPRMNLDSSKRKQSYLTKQGECTSTMKSHTRTIQSSWYKLHPWISVCTTNYKVFCATCFNGRDQGLRTISMNQKWTSFVSGGFSNWKNALAKFREHEGSNSHKESAMKLAAKKCVGIDAQLSSQLRNQQAHHRTMLMRLLESIQFLVRQGLPLRGHKEDLADLEGNLYQLLLLRCDAHGNTSLLHTIIKGVK